MQFLHPEYLYGLAAIAIPIIIHLFNFRRFKKVLFTNVAYLRELKQQTKKQSRLRHLLALLFRILAIIMIVLAFAQPFFPTEKAVLVHNSNITIIYLDNSFSMEGVSGKATALQKAKNKVVEISNFLPKNNLYHLISNEFTGGFQLLQKEELIARISKLQLTSIQRDFTSVRKRINEIKKRDKLEEVQIYFISDFQKINFKDNITLQDTSLRWDLLPIKIQDVKNLHLDSCWFKTPVNQSNASISLGFRLSNSSPEKGSKIPVRLLVDGKEIAVIAVDIEANSQKDFSLSFSNNKAGYHEGLLELDDYPISFDNQLYFSFQIEDKIKVLEIDGKNKNPYLNALFSKDSLIDYSTVSEMQIPYDKLDTYQSVFLNELTNFSSGFLGRLQEYVEQGGNLVFLPGNVATENRSFSNALNLATYAKVDTSRLSVSFIQLQHNLFGNVFEKVPKNPDFPTVFKHYTLTYSAHSDAMSLIDLENGNSLLLAFSRGNGTIFQFACPINDRFTDFQKNALFVPTFYNMALLSRNKTALYHLIGEEGQLFIKDIKMDEKDMLHIKAKGENFEYIPRVQSSGNNVKIFIMNELTKAGFYTVENKTKTYGLLAMNYNRRESVLSFMDTEEIRSYFKIENNPSIHLLSSVDDALIQNLKEENPSNDLWYWFVVFALLFLLMEIVVLRFL